MKTSNKSDRNKKVYICKMCGQSIEPLKFTMEDYAYKRNIKGSKIMYYCSYHCMRASLEVGMDIVELNKIIRNTNKTGCENNEVLSDRAYVIDF